MMRENEYVVVAPGAEHVLERVSGELLKRHTFVESLWVAEQGNQAVCRLHGDLVLGCDDLNALEAVVVERPSGGGI